MGSDAYQCGSLRCQDAYEKFREETPREVLAEMRNINPVFTHANIRVIFQAGYEAGEQHNSRSLSVAIGAISGGIAAAIVIFLANFL